MSLPRRASRKPGAMSTPVRFLLASGVAAAVNFATRIVFSLFAPYAVAIVLAFLAGMTTAFLLNRRYVFTGSTNVLHRQIFWFVVVNLLALVQTLLVSLLLARVVLPALGVEWHAEEIAHAVGIVIPVFTSYVSHRHLTFR